MIATVWPGALRGAVRAPASKSAAHRALICAALADGPTALEINALNDDIEATARCLERLGASIRYDEGAGVMDVRPIEIARREVELDCGESGSTLRFLMPLAAALRAEARFTGHGRLPERPNGALAAALREHGACVDSDRLPMNVRGPVSGGRWALPGNISSQYVTGLLMALPLIPEDSEIALTTRLESEAYVDMTVDMLGRFGVVVDRTETGWRVPGSQAYRTPGRVRVEGDWSAAAFWLAANAMGAAVQVTGLSDSSAQGDKAVVRLLGQQEIDASGVPDLVPALAAAAAVAPGRTVITGAARLRLKESDRLRATADMIAALGGRAEVTEDGLVIEGGLPLRGGTVEGFGDHRIVMAAAILATRASGPVRVTDAQAVRKSYPGFFDDFRALGGRVHVEPAGE